MQQIVTQIDCDAILFDLDGVLIDSTSTIVRHWTHWADRHGLDIDQIMRAAYGVRAIETMRQVAPHLDIEAEAAQFAAREIADSEVVLAIDGAAAILGALPDDAWAIVTSAGLDLAKTRLAQVGLPIPKNLVTAEQVKQGKPAPDPYLAGAHRLSLAPSQCVVIEDAPAGIAAGRAAGMRVIGVCSTHTRQELLACEVNYVLDRLPSLRIRPGLSGHRLRLEIGGQA